VNAASGERPDLRAPLVPLELGAIQERFESIARAEPDRVAMASSHGNWTYGELERLSNALARKLHAEGIAPGEVVAIVTDRTPALVCGMLAVLKTGAAFAMVNEAYPDARVAACIRASRARIALLFGAADRFAERDLAQASALSLPTTRADMAHVLGHWHAAPVVPVTPETPAYMMFTSGSTGEPKCVVTGHAPLPHFLDWQRSTFGLTRDDRFSMLSGLSHDPLLRDVFAPLSVGATLCVPDGPTLLDPTLLRAWLAANRITVTHLTPPLGRIVLAGTEPARLPDLRFWFWGGDVLRPDLVEELRGVSSARHVNFYGTTETPQGAGFFEVGALDGVTRIPVGRGISDVDLVVRADDGSLAPIGELGELCVRTRYLSLGYVGDEGEGRRKYEVNALTGDPGDRLYKTGDLALFLPDGSVELRGRADDQVKIRGFRVELGEVTSALLKLPEVRDAVTLAPASPAGEPRIVAYVTAAPSASPTPQSLAAAMRSALPAYMCPSAFLTLPSLPLLPNGKVDRRALMAMPLREVPRETETGSAEELKLAKLWAGILGVESVGLNESFYDLGGDSLMAVRVMIGMRKAGLDEAACRLILRGFTISQIVAGESTMNAAPARQSAEHRRLVLNVLRGVMVVLVVASHWVDGVVRRAPVFAKVEELMNPLLGWPTPGFAIAFGMTLALLHHAHALNPTRTTKMLFGSAGIVAAGVLILAVDHHMLLRYGLPPMNEPFPMAHPYISPFDGILTYYGLALVSAPFWFAYLRGRFLVQKALGAALVLAAIYAVLIRQALEPSSPAHFMVVLGKFSYINLSAGAFAGLALGIAWRSWPEIPARLAAFGLLMCVAGAVLSSFDPDASLWGMSGRVEVWGWLFWGGLTLCGLYSFDRVLHTESPVIVELGRSVAVLGQLAFPLVLLDFIARDIGNVGTAIGQPLLRLAIPVFLFFGVAVVLFRKTYGLYYGTSGAAAPGAEAQG
jgi:amino acid adenylation domain-containing protein